ncbi:MAG: VOC family protein [Chitinophagales bacterium]
MTVHHIAIICSDIERSKKFYIDIFGCTIRAEHFRAERNSWKVDLAIDENIYLELFTFPDAAARPSYPEAMGLRHLAFGTTDIHAEHTRIKDLGVSCEDIRTDIYTGKQFFFFSDPDGLPLELYSL